MDQQLAACRNFSRMNMRHARSRNLTAYDVLLIASMIDREASVARERRLIASVIYNRLREGIPPGDRRDDPLRDRELDGRSRSRSRGLPQHAHARGGLPPGPIGSPGLASIQAAARPARTKYLYYVIKPRGEGAVAFSATYAQFQARLGPLRTRAAEGRWPLARELLERARRRSGLPGGPQPLAGDDGRGVRRARLDWRYFRPVPPELFRETVEKASIRLRRAT